MLRLTVERVRRGWSKTELGFRAKIHPNVIGQLESGRLKPFDPWKRKLEKTLEVPAEELFKEV